MSLVYSLGKNDKHYFIQGSHMFVILSFVSIKSNSTFVHNSSNPWTGLSDWECLEKRDVVACEGANHKYVVHWWKQINQEVVH